VEEAELCEAIQEGTNELLTRVALTFNAEDAWVDRLRAVAYEMARFLQEDPERTYAMAVEVLSAGPRAQSIRDAGIQTLVELIDQGRQELADPDSMTRATAEGIAGAVYNRIHLEVAAGNFDGTAFVPKLMYNAVLPYLGTEAALAELHRPPPTPPCKRVS
jgi:AcrR family transcriptional regulator